MTKALILIVEDDPLQRKLLGENLAREGYGILEAAGGAEARALAAGRPVEIAVVDYRLGEEKGTDVIRNLIAGDPLITPIMVTAYGNIERAVEAVREGAYDYIAKPIDIGKLLLVIERALERHKLKKEISDLRSSLRDDLRSKDVIIASSRMEAVGRLLARAASTEATVLISGETGTGKDLAAKTIHYSSRRKEGPYLAVNLPSLPESLVESELFGAEKGAYTGANEKKTGKFEAASGGTLYLDEIGDLPAHIQVKLLRFLQEKEFYRLGSSTPRRSDVRIIAATNRDLDGLVRTGTFRPDLFYRLNVIRVEMPPLRARKEDIPPLVDLFIKKFARRESKPVTGISREAMALLLAYPFPGNIRELENIIERAIVFLEGDTIRTEDLPVFLKEKTEEAIDDSLGLPGKIRQTEIREIRRALERSGGVKSRAARALGLTERMLSYKIKIYGIRFPGP